VESGFFVDEIIVIVIDLLGRPVELRKTEKTTGVGNALALGHQVLKVFIDRTLS